MIQRMLAIWALVPLPFLKPAWTSVCSWFTYCWNLTWWILSITLLACEISAIGIGMKTDLFQSCGHCWVFQICWHIECSTFRMSFFRFWNSSTGIPPPPLALFVVMLPKAHLTSHSRMSGSQWVITPLWLSGSWGSFLYSSSVHNMFIYYFILVMKLHLLNIVFKYLYGKQWYVMKLSFHVLMSYSVGQRTK